MYEGVITATLQDPFSILVTYFNSFPNENNAVGYYFHENNVCYVLLFNTWSAHKIYLTPTKEYLTLAALRYFATNIVLYPINFLEPHGIPILTLEELDNKKPGKLSKEKFLDLINAQNLAISTVTNNYDFLMVNDFSDATTNGLSPGKLKIENLIPRTTGYSLVNQTLYSLRDKKYHSHSHNQIHNMRIFRPAIIVPIGMKSLSQDFLVKAKQEIIKFLDFLVMRLQNPIHQQNPIEIENLVLSLYEGFRNGALNKIEIGEHIRTINKNRATNLLPIPDTLASELKIVNYSYSYPPEHFLNNLNKIAKYLQNLCTVLENDEHPILNLAYIIHHLNKVLNHHNLPPIILNIEKSSEEKVKTFLVENSDVALMVNKKDTMLTLDNPSFDNLNREELIEVLIYLDSARSDEGLQDPKFIALQNKIIALLNK